MTSRRFATAVLFLVVCGQGVALLASIPDPSGLIHGCISGPGHLRIIDSATETCKKNETSISWSVSPTATDHPDPSVFDSNGLYVGSLVAGEHFLDNDRVIIRISSTDVLAPRLLTTQILPEPGGADLWYQTTDCSGQRYIEGGHGLTKRFSALPGKLV